MNIGAERVKRNEMEKQQLKKLRKKQMIYTNLIYLLYMFIIVILIFIQASAMIVYSILGVIFLISPVSLFFNKRPNPILQIFPGMKKLIDYERQKLGEISRKYFMAGAVLQILLSGFCFFQAMIRGSVSFIEGIPWWYLLMAAILLIYIGNLNLRFHIRRFDQKDAQALSVYAKDQALFTFVFAAVFLVFVIIGAFLVLVVFA